MTAAAEQAQDVTILINNAGASVRASYLDSAMEDVRRDLETNFYGPLLAMAAGVDAPKADPRDVAVAALDGIEAGAHEVLADDLTRWGKSQLSADPEALYPQLNK